MMATSAACQQRFYDVNHIIPPPLPGERTTRRMRVMVDSRFRDRARFPRSSQFEMPLDDELDNVTELSLVSYNVPKQVYTVNESNNMLWFTEELVLFDTNTRAPLPLDAAQVKSVTIEPGAYSPEDLAGALRAAINGASRSAIAVEYNTITCKYEFSSSLFDPATNKYVSFSIINVLGEMVRNTIAPCIGLNPAKNYMGAFAAPVKPANAVVYTEEAKGVRQGQRVVLGDVITVPQLFTVVSVQPSYPKYVVLNGTYSSRPEPVALNHGTIHSETHSILDIPEEYYLLEVDRFRGDMLPRSLPVNAALAVLHPAGTIQVDDNRYTRVLNPPISGLRSLKITVRNHDGTVCNFENRELFLEFFISQETTIRTF
jgi:hypothetical protein